MSQDGLHFEPRRALKEPQPGPESPAAASPLPSAPRRMTIRIAPPGRERQSARIGDRSSSARVGACRVEPNAWPGPNRLRVVARTARFQPSIPPPPLEKMAAASRGSRATLDDGQRRRPSRGRKMARDQPARGRAPSHRLWSRRSPRSARSRIPVTQSEVPWPHTRRGIAPAPWRGGENPERLPAQARRLRPPRANAEAPSRSHQSGAMIGTRRNQSRFSPLFFQLIDQSTNCLELVGRRALRRQRLHHQPLG